MPGIFLLLSVLTIVPLASPAHGLTIYFIDTEGGAATLVVTPAGESVLIDCGNPGSRDADRIYQTATQRAGLKAIDHLIITHWHLDHFGGIERLSSRMPIHHYYDRGIPLALPEDPKNYPLLIQAYKTACGGKSHILHPGEEIPLRSAKNDLHLLCLCARGEVVRDSPRARENDIAREHKPQPDDPSDNARSLGFLLRVGDFRFLNLGDLTWNIEYKLVHPTDKVGPVDVYQSTHHGLEISNNPVLIKTVKPRVAIFNNGARKGCHPAVVATLRRVPDLQAIYQLHRNLQTGDQENTESDKIANHDENCRGEGIKLVLAPDAKSYTITVGEKGQTRTYKIRGIVEK